MFKAIESIIKLVVENDEKIERVLNALTPFLYAVAVLLVIILLLRWLW